MKKIIIYLENLFKTISLVCLVFWIMIVYIEVFNIRIEVNKSLFFYGFFVFGLKNNYLFLQSLFRVIKTLPTDIQVLVLGINKVSLGQRQTYLKITAILIKLFLSVINKIYRFLYHNFFWKISPYLLLAADIIISRYQIDFLTLLTLINWIFVMKHFHRDSRMFFRNALVLVIIGSVLALLKLNQTAEKAVLWTYYFLLLGVIKTFFENRLPKTNANKIT